MGNKNSLAARPEIHSKLDELAGIVQAAGDFDAARMLRQISGSHKLIWFCRDKLISEVHGRRDPTKDLSTIEWFRAWESKGKTKLSDGQIDRLANFTNNWNHRTKDDVPQNIRDWISEPISKFWGFKAFNADTNLVECCLSDIDETEGSPKMNPIRRRVMLVILYDIVQREKEQLQAEAKERKNLSRDQKKKKTKFISAAIKNVLDRTYRSHNLSEDARMRMHKRCTQLQRYGGRWSLFERREAIIEFPVTNAANNFERASMEEAEIEALNAYEETVYENEYRHVLRQAFQEIYNAYSHRRKLPFRCPQTGASAPAENSSSKAGKKRSRNNNPTATGPARKRSCVNLLSGQGDDAQSSFSRPQHADIGTSVLIDRPTATEDSGIGSSESISSGYSSPRSGLLTCGIQSIGNPVHSIQSPAEPASSVSHEAPSGLRIHRELSNDNTSWELSQAASRHVAALAPSTGQDCHSNQGPSHEVCSASNMEDIVTRVDGQYSAVPTSTTTEGMNPRNLSIIRSNTHGEAFRHTSNVVAQGFENALYTTQGGSSVQDVARGFENVLPHHAAMELGYEDVSGCHEDGFYQSMQGGSSFQDVARGFENVFSHNAAMELGYGDISGCHEDGLYQSTQGAPNVQDVARGFENVFSHNAAMELGYEDVSGCNEDGLYQSTRAGSSVRDVARGFGNVSGFHGNGFYQPQTNYRNAIRECEDAFYPLTSGEPNYGNVTQCFEDSLGEPMTAATYYHMQGIAHYE